jgi:hypothetical protein
MISAAQAFRLFGGLVMKDYSVERTERRVPMAIAVQLSGHTNVQGTESTFTENVSANGARVYSVRPWRKNDRLMLASLPGGFRSLARVTYCQSLHGQGFALGLQFLEKNQGWVIEASGTADNQNQSAA